MRARAADCQEFNVDEQGTLFPPRLYPAAGGCRDRFAKREARPCRVDARRRRDDRDARRKSQASRRRQQLGPPRVELGGSRGSLAFRPMPVTAGAVRDASGAAIVALRDMAPKRRRPARRDRAHDAAFAAAKTTPGVIAKIDVAMTTDDVGEFDRRPFHSRVTRAASPPGKGGPAGSSSR